MDEQFDGIIELLERSKYCEGEEREKLLRLAIDEINWLLEQ